MALKGDASAYQFPRSFFHEDRLDFSFSGLKTAVRYAIGGPGCGDVSDIELSEDQVANLSASFQQAVVDCLVKKAVQAIEQTKLKNLCVGGGVAANRLLRTQLESTCAEKDISLHIAPLEYCTDNAVMGAIAVERFKAGLFEDLTLDIKPGLVRH